MATIETAIVTRPDIVIAIPLLAMLAVATTIDLRHHRIPNGLTLGAAVVGVSMQGALLGPSGVGLGALGWVVGLLCFLPFYLAGGMAAGDVKLMAAVGAFVGPVDAFLACVATMIVGGAVGMAYLAWQKSSCAFARPAEAGDGPRVSGGPAQAAGASYGGEGGGPPPARSVGRMPYAIAIAIGTAIVVLQPSFLSLLTNGGWS